MLADRTRSVRDARRPHAARGARTYFDPQVCLVFRNYLDNRAKYQGIGNYNDSGFASMERALPLAAKFRQAIATAGLNVVYGTDAVAGAHGRNVEELVCRVRDGGQKPMDAIMSATSLNAQAIGMGKQLGPLPPASRPTSLRPTAIRPRTSRRCIASHLS